MEQWIALIVQSGALGVALYLAYLNSQKDKVFSQLVQNHLNHNTLVLSELKEIIKELCIYIKKQ